MAYQLTQQHPKKRAFITGGGGGLGRALALALANDGWTVGITDIKNEALAESKQLIEAAGGKAFTYQFDVSKREEYKKAFDEFIASTGGIDVLINNAGIGINQSFETTTNLMASLIMAAFSSCCSFSAS